MRVVIAGGSGMIGRAVAAGLVEAGYQVAVLSRSPRSVRGLPASTEVHAWDGRSTGGWADLVDGAEAIVHLAGESIAGDDLPSILLQRWSAEKKARIVGSRVEAGRAIVGAVERAKRKPSVLVQISGVGIYGVGNPGSLGEDSPPGTDFLAQTCVAWESATAPVEALGVRRVILRTSAVLARGGAVLRLLSLPFRLFVGGPLGGGRQPFPWVHLDDVVGAFRFAIETPQVTGPLNLSVPQTISNAEFGRSLAAALDRPNWFPLPGWALRLVLGEKATVVLEGQRPAPSRLLSHGFRFRYPDANTALRDLLS